MINIQIFPSYRQLIDRLLIENAAKTTLIFNKTDPETDLSIVVGGKKKIQQLNKQFSGKDAPTDVLSFPVVSIDPETQRTYIGDIIISYPTAKSNALKTQHTVDEELRLLIIHGVLHLLGYDHTGEADKAEMWDIQQKILDHLGCEIHP